MNKLFEQSEINGMQLANRFVRSATWEGMAADDGACTPKLRDLMADLAAGGVGLIISSHAYVSPEGQAGPQIGDPDHQKSGDFLCRCKGKAENITGNDINKNQNKHDPHHDSDQHLICF